MQFPRLVYKSASHHKGVKNAEEHAAALAEGWHDTVPAALGHKAQTPSPAPKAGNGDASGVNAAATPSTPVSAPAKRGKQPSAPAPAAGAAKNPWD